MAFLVVPWLAALLLFALSRSRGLSLEVARYFFFNRVDEDHAGHCSDGLFGLSLVVAGVALMITLPAVFLR